MAVKKMKIVCLANIISPNQMLHFHRDSLWIWIREKSEKKLNLMISFLICILKWSQKRLYTCCTGSLVVPTPTKPASFIKMFTCGVCCLWIRYLKQMSPWFLSLLLCFAASTQNAGKPLAATQRLVQKKKKNAVYRFKFDYAQPYVNRENVLTLSV